MFLEELEVCNNFCSYCLFLKAHVHPRDIARRAEFLTVENSENYQRALDSESNPHSSSSFPGISLFFVSLSFA